MNLLPTRSSFLASLIASTSQVRYLAAKKPPPLTDAQIQFQKHTAELGFREKTTIKGTLFDFHDVETSKAYLNSQAFKEAYGNKLIWQWYIRNFKGRFPKSYTREMCIKHNRYATGNPCPICRDPYLVVHYTNLDLLTHFISPDTGRLFPTLKTGVCRKQHENLEIAFEKAKDYGLIDHYIPDRLYDYSVYYPGEARFQQDADKQGLSVMLGVILGSNRKQINHIFTDLKEEDIVKK